MNPAAWSSRQKSLRGFAKCAAAAAETRPGLIPQNTILTFWPGAGRASGTSKAPRACLPTAVHYSSWPTLGCTVGSFLE